MSTNIGSASKCLTVSGKFTKEFTDIKTLSPLFNLIELRAKWRAAVEVAVAIAYFAPIYLTIFSSNSKTFDKSSLAWRTDFNWSISSLSKVALYIAIFLIFTSISIF